MVNITSDAMRGFFRATSMHLSAADELLRASRPAATEKNWVALYLSGYAVECSLKARYLDGIKPSRHEAVIDQIFKRTVKHDLEELKRVLGVQDVYLPRPQKLALQAVKTRWSPEMRYRTELIEYEEALRYSGRLRSSHDGHYEDKNHDCNTQATR